QDVVAAVPVVVRTADDGVHARPAATDLDTGPEAALAVPRDLVEPPGGGLTGDEVGAAVHVPVAAERHEVVDAEPRAERPLRAPSSRARGRVVQELSRGASHDEPGLAGLVPAVGADED